MAKDPAFLFYSQDFLTGISDLTMEERGQYITLLCLQHQKGHLTKKAITISVPNISRDVLLKFKVDDKGLFFNERLEIEREKRAEYSKKQRQRALDGWKKRKDMQNHGNATANATALPLEDENVNKDIIESKKEIVIPSQNEFLEHAKQSCVKAGRNFQELEFSIISKYESWIEAKWKDGNGKKIKIWKTKFNNTLPHLKAIKQQNNGQQISTNEALDNLING